MIRADDERGTLDLSEQQARVVASDLIQTDELDRQRRRKFRRSIAWLAFFPAISYGLMRLLVLERLWQPGATFSDYLRYALSYEMRDGLVTSMMMHFLLWCLWKEQAERSRRGAILLFIAFMVGGLLRAAVVHALSFSGYGLERQLLMSLGFGACFFVCHYVFLSSAETLYRFRLVDMQRRPDSTQHHNGSWSIRGMFLTTLFAAVVLLFLKWQRQNVAQSNQDQWYPTSDFAYVAWMLAAAAGNLLALFAAAERVTKSTWIAPIGMLFAGVAAFEVGWHVWVYFVPTRYPDDFHFKRSAMAITNILWMFVFHLMAFRIWRRMQYQLTRSRARLLRS